MPEETQILYILGPVGILFFFAIKEFFSYLKSRNSRNGTSKIETDIALIKQQLDNHIEHISTELIQMNANLKKNTDDTNEIKLSVAILKEKLDK